MLKANATYTWEMESINGIVLPQYEKDGTENKWTRINPDAVVRISYIPAIPVLPRHDIFIDHSKGEKFIRRYGRGFLRARNKFELKEYIYCVVTNRYKFNLFHNGRVLITNNEYEVYL